MTVMGRDEVLDRLRTSRMAFDQRVAAIPRERLAMPAPGSAHSPKDIVAHVSAYEDLIVERLIAARRGETTAFDRDRDGWEAFNARVWSEAESREADEILARSASVFGRLLEEVGSLSDVELAGPTGVAAVIDQGWLQGRPLAELIAIDGFDHYPMHFAALEAAANVA